MILIIDTYNVLHVTGVLPPELAGVDTGGLIGLIRSSRYAHCRVELVCDGTPSGGLSRERVGLIRVRHAGPGREADDLIAALIRASSTPRRLIVVSADHFVQREARRRRCRVLGSNEFLRQLAEDAQAARPGRAEGRAGLHKPFAELTEAQVAKWMDIFGVGEAPEAAAEAGPDSAPSLNDADAAHASADVPERPRGDEGVPIPESIIAEAERIWREHVKEDELR